MAKQSSKASTPVKAGDVPANTVPVITFQDAMNAASQQIDALLRGGTSCVTFISSALLVGYLSNATAKVKLSVMRDEFALALGKKGLGGTQTKKYLDYGSKLAGQMFKECSYGQEIAVLLAADNPDKAHDAVTSYLRRKTEGQKTEHGYDLSEAHVKLNALGVFLGFEKDPAKPEALPGNDTEADRTVKRRENAAKNIEKDPAILSKVPAEQLLSTVSQVISFDVLIRKHVETMTEAKAIEKELAAITKAYQARIKALRTNLGKKVTKPEVSDVAAAA